MFSFSGTRYVLAFYSFFIGIIFCIASSNVYAQKRSVKPSNELQFSIDSIFNFAARQYKKLVDTDFDTLRIPFSSNANGTWERVPSDDWMSGFLGGILWYIYEHNREPYWQKAAEFWTAPLRKEQFMAKHHDIGFMLYCSFGNGLRLTQNESYKPILIQAAKTAISRFNPTVGTIKSWNRRPGEHYTIIDNMMNLELLLWAFKETKDSTFYKVAVRHADVTLQNHFRPDHTSYHVLVYDSASGSLVRKITAQGYSDNSMWARGNAWGIYGFTMMYRETGLERYRIMAQQAADVFIKKLPTDHVPYWDFDAPITPQTKKDASAGAIAASAFIDLSILAETKTDKAKYYKAAVNQLNALSTSSFLAVEENYQCVLLHSGYNVAKNHMADVNMTFADYYYLEALHKLKALKSKSAPNNKK
jgi:unsaturated chondroitin disaccharide hydrolase